MKRIKTVQEPDYPIASPPVPKDPKTIFITGLLQKYVEMNGEKIPVVQQADGIIGFMLVFDEYSKALAWVNGRAELITKAII